jgi:hypothetical protein
MPVDPTGAPAPHRISTVHILGPSSALGTSLAADTAGMAKKPKPPKPTTWTIYKIAAKAVRLGAVEALDEAAAAMEKGVEFKVPATRLIAIRR